MSNAIPLGSSPGANGQVATTLCAKVSIATISLLSSMLQRVQAELSQLNRFGMTMNAKDATHATKRDSPWPRVPLPRRIGS